MNINRREFLKLAGLLTASSINPSITRMPTAQLQDPNAPNIVIFVFDTLSAKHLPFYGYPRQTMPNLARLLDHATVYHQHYSVDNYTTSATASLFTGTYPWTHRAFKLSDTAAPEYETKNLFSLFDQYYRVAYTHNPVAEVLLDQFNQDITLHKLREELYINSTWWIDRIFKRDYDAASLSWTRVSNPEIDGLVYSLLFSERLNKLLDQVPKGFKDLFPRGLPYGLIPQNYFLLEHATDWIQSQVDQFTRPYLGYFHMLPPHGPYTTRFDFIDQFLDDGFSAPEKDYHHISPKDRNSPDYLLENRRHYDEYILYVDTEFGRIFEYMEAEGLLENTWIIFTSDHGELFERGFLGHSSPHLFEPVVRIPLVIFEPGQKTRKDITTPTSCTDLLPTLLDLTGQPIPDWIEGEILPPYRQEASNPNRRVYAYHGKQNPEKYGELLNGTMMLVGERFKAIRYFGYTNAYDHTVDMKSDPWYEVYDIINDPEELDNLALSDPARAKDVIEEAERKFEEIKGPYQG